ncbi:hypothetical protein [Spiroplasma alleghenense]|uniref:Transmembrane protein n=1 Tax=Spiroplasma alleghenense TaxID=216931 RepID=A0A345Z2D0_9MOLU|nr:hypothetical protein [Spiroplasma alleghenense]AXK50759.1 hypothetical protein SALLE_v1c00830 [Spiroplasma alleghenense]
MDIGKFRKITKKPVLWIGAINVIILLIALPVILTIELSLIMKITITSQFILDLVLINSVIGVLNFGKTPIALLYETHFDVEVDTDSAKSVEFKKSRYCYWITSILPIVTFFIIVSSTTMANNINFGEGFKVAWGPALILALINFTLLLLNFSLTVYLLNTNEEIIKTTLSWRKKFKEEMIKESKEITTEFETIEDVEDVE